MAREVLPPLVIEGKYLRSLIGLCNGELGDLIACLILRLLTDIDDDEDPTEPDNERAMFRLLLDDIDEYREQFWENQRKKTQQQ